MNAINLKNEASGIRGAQAMTCRHHDDPLDPNDEGDTILTTSRRGLVRLASVATEVGARFQREGVGHDPVAWMLAPRRLFDGDAALDACLEREACLRALILHGLSLGLDADPGRIDALLCDTPGGDFHAGNWPEDEGGRVPSLGRSRRLRLYSAIMVTARGGELIHLFHASVAASASVVRERIRARFGAVAAAQADIRAGVDLECPVTAGLVPPAFRDMVAGRRRVRWSTLEGLDVTVEHRIPS